MAVNNLEKRLRVLEDELKALKAICPISGSLAEMFIVKSDLLTVGGSSNLHAIEVDFMPTFTSENKYLITLLPVVTSTYGGYTWTKIANYIIPPQDNSGKIRIKVYNLINTDKVQIIASGTSPGTFTRIS